MRALMLISFCLIFFSCKRQPKIPISNTLEIALGSRYSDYVSCLNKAFGKDTTGLLNFLKIDYFDDGAVYDHGFILFQLTKIYGDKSFSNALQKLTERDLRTVSKYFEAGLDASDKQKNEMKIGYPITSEILQLR